MDILRLLTTLLSLIQRLLELDARTWKGIAAAVARLIGRGDPQSSYENVSLSIELELCDTKGKRATLRRTQRVRFLAAEAGVVRDVVWGEGKSLAGYTVEGAEQLSVRHEGSKKVVLLGLPTSPGKGEDVTLKTERTILDGFRPSEGYLETVVERATKRLRLQVLFPRQRPPKEVRLEASPPVIAARPLAVRLTKSGRGYATWGMEEPKRLVTYRIRWSW
ncbi:MAG: hypothetical protein IT300_16665 [Dehalococcoidia bacterium]|jgi:hypothetical protein|nr:hypothetical protein [Dehalococcoidia bacterium]